MKSDNAKIEVLPRPYVMTFLSSGHSYPLTSEEAERLISEYPAIRASKNAVTLRGDGVGNNTVIRAATLGGGPAFRIIRQK